MAVVSQEYTLVPLDSVVPHPDNPRQGDVSQIRASIDANGFYGTLVVQASSRRIVAGNHRWLAAQAAGMSELPAVLVDVDDATAMRILAVDNRSNDLAGYDDAALLSLLQSVALEPGGLVGTGFTDADLAGLAVGFQPLSTVDDPDSVPEMPPDPRSVLGDVWQLGPHRLICADSSDPGVLDALVRSDKVGCILTDPPYGMNLDTDWSGVGGSNKAMMRGVPGGKYRPVIGDDVPFDAGFLRSVFKSVPEQFWFGADYYRRTLSADDTDGSWLVWDKRSETADAGFGSGFELIWSAGRHKRDLLRHYWFGAFGGAEARGRMHPTQKPTALLREMLDRWAPKGCVVADFYGGSGSTLLAAHMTGRVARLVEIDPRYCDVICRRFQNATGVKPVLESSGEPQDFTDGC